MKKTIRVGALAAAVLTSTAAFAHPGHPHAGGSPVAHHVLEFGLLAAVVLGGVLLAIRQWRKS